MQADGDKGYEEKILEKSQHSHHDLLLTVLSLLFFLPFLPVLLFISLLLSLHLLPHSPLLFPLFPFSLEFLFQQMLFSFHAYSGFEYHWGAKRRWYQSQKLCPGRSWNGWALPSFTTVTQQVQEAYWVGGWRILLPTLFLGSVPGPKSS